MCSPIRLTRPGARTLCVEAAPKARAATAAIALPRESWARDDTAGSNGSVVVDAFLQPGALDLQGAERFRGEDLLLAQGLRLALGQEHGIDRAEAESELGLGLARVLATEQLVDGIGG